MMEPDDVVTPGLLGSINQLSHAVSDLPEAMKFFTPLLFGPGGYYAVHSPGPDRLKYEVVHMPLAESRFKEWEWRIEGSNPHVDASSRK